MISGTIRLCHYYGDGRRQVVAFPLAGDVFGFDSHFRYVSAEALTKGEFIWHGWDTHRLAFDFGGPETPTPAPAPLERALRLAEENLKFFSYATASQRLAAFLIDFHRRQGRPDTIDLPMSRLDIAEHLGLTMYTISRAFSHLSRSGMIDCPTPHRIVLRRKVELMQSAGIEEADFTIPAMSLVA